MKYFLYFLFICPSLFFSCKDDTTGQSDIATSGQTSVRFDSLIEYNPFKAEKPDHSPYQIVTYVNVSCPPCLEEINKWNDFNKEFNNGSFTIKLICYSDDYFEYFKYLCENGSIKSFPFPFSLDTIRSFTRQNHLFSRAEVDKTAVLSSDNKVLFTGNPLHSDQARKTFINLLK